MVVLMKRLRKAVQKPLRMQTLEDQWNFSKCRWGERNPSRGPALAEVSPCQGKAGRVQEKSGVVGTWHF